MSAAIQTTEVFDRWFAKLKDRAAKARIQVRIDRLALGNPGHHRKLKQGVAEMKIDHGPGYRVYYVTRAGVTYILLCGGDKQSQDADIELAQSMADHV